MGPGTVWPGAENLAPTRIRLPDCPARSESLYHLSYSGHILFIYICLYNRICVLKYFADGFLIQRSLKGGNS